MSGLLSDCRLAVRMLAKRPWTTAVAVLSLAIAIGPNSAVFTVLNALSPTTPSGVAARLFRLRSAQPETGQWFIPSYLDVLDYGSQAHDVAEIVAYKKRGVVLVSALGREMVSARWVTENYFLALGTHAAAGRLLARSDGQSTGTPPIVISHSLAVRQFGEASCSVGKNLSLSGRVFAVVGVVARGFHEPLLGLTVPDVWIPLGATPASERTLLMDRGSQIEEAFVVVKKDVPSARAEAVLSAIAQRLARDYPESNRGTSVKLITPPSNAPAQMVLAFIGLILLIACANVAGILMAYGEARRREFSIRQALGAPRGRLIRLLVVESVLLALAAAVLGLLMANGVMQALKNYQPIAFAPIHLDLQLDFRVVSYTLFLSVVAALAAGLSPALRFSRPQLLQDLRSGVSVTEYRQGFRMALVVLQVAVSQFLLICAVLLVGSHSDAQQVRPGIDLNRSVVAAWLTGISEADSVDYARLEDRLRAVPQVVRVSSTSFQPMGGTGGGTVEVFLPGMDDLKVRVNVAKVGPNYFSIMGTRLLRGQDLETNAPGAVIVNETMARQFWGSADEAMGKPLRVGETASRVVGVAEDGKYRQLDETPIPFVFVSAPLSPNGEGVLLIETIPGQAKAMLGLLRSTIRDTQPDAGIVSLLTLPQLMDLPLLPYRIAATMVTILAVLGVFLAGVGLHGLIACSVAQRTREIGLRVALGAAPADILGAVLPKVMWHAMLGSLIGVAVALVAAGILSRMIPGVRSVDPIGTAVGVLAFLTVAALAASAPARRAIRVDPMKALRED